MDADGSRESLLRRNTCLAPMGSEKQKTSFKDNDPNKLSKIGRLSAGILFLGFLVSLIGGLLVDPTSNILKNYFSTDEKTLQSLKSVIDKCTLFCLIYFLILIKLRPKDEV